MPDNDTKEIPGNDGPRYRSGLPMNIKYTPTQQRMLAVLADGNRHTREELHACLNDTLGPRSNIWAHLTFLRGKLQPQGQDILCEYRFKHFYYRHIRYLNS